MFVIIYWHLKRMCLNTSTLVCLFIYAEYSCEICKLNGNMEFVRHLCRIQLTSFFVHLDLWWWEASSCLIGWCWLDIPKGNNAFVQMSSERNTPVRWFELWMICSLSSWIGIFIIQLIHLYKSLFTNHYDGMGSSLFGWLCSNGGFSSQSCLTDQPQMLAYISLQQTTIPPSKNRRRAPLPFLFFFLAQGFETHLPVAGGFAPTAPFFDSWSDGTTTGQVLSVQQEPLPVGFRGFWGFRWNHLELLRYPVFLWNP